MAVNLSISLVFLTVLCIIRGSIPFAGALTIVEHPKNASVYNGQSHIFNCIFDQAVKCSWTHNDIITAINGRYNFVSGSGIDTPDCSIQISNFSRILDGGRWQCMNKESSVHLDSNIAHLSELNAVQPNRTVILLNDTIVYDIWVPKNGDMTGNLICVAEYAIPHVTLFWTLNHDQTVQPVYMKQSCIINGYCNTTLPWPDDDWKQLTSASSLQCLIEQGGFSENVLSVNLTVEDNGVPGKSSGLQAGVIVGMAVILVIHGGF